MLVPPRRAVAKSKPLLMPSPPMMSSLQRSSNLLILSRRVPMSSPTQSQKLSKSPSPMCSKPKSWPRSSQSPRYQRASEGYQM